jgi:hypothetical protein
LKNHHPRARSVLYIMRQFGLDPIKFFWAVRVVPRFLLDRLVWRNQHQPNTQTLPSLHDRRDNAGASDGHYFWQDLITARWIFLNSPGNHLDVGSRIDGFVAHLLSFRQIDVLDIRNVESTIPNLRFIQGDAMKNLEDLNGSYESVSSLHAIEHFGLGRYGDEISKDGHIFGLDNIARCVADGGHLYLSFPLGGNQTQFNTQRLLDPLWPTKQLKGFKLLQYVEIPWKGPPDYSRTLDSDYIPPIASAGLYHFQRTETLN